MSMLQEIAQLIDSRRKKPGVRSEPQLYKKVFKAAIGEFVATGAKAKIRPLSPHLAVFVVDSRLDLTNNQL